MNLVRRNTVLATHQHPQSREPFLQRDRRILEDGFDFDGELATARAALPPFLCRKVVMLAVSALRAHGASWPPELSDCIDAGLFVTEVPNGLLECFGLHGVSH